MRSFLRTILSAVAAFAFAAPAMASSITYTEVGTGSGTLDGHSFTSQLVTITMTANTSNITNLGSGVFENTGTTSVTVSTVGTDTLTNPDVFVNPNFHFGVDPVAGFGVGSQTVMATIASPFGGPPSYALGAIGPTTGTPVISSGVAFATGSDHFDLTTIGNTTFSATITPLPAALPLFATGLGALGLLGWRRKRKAQAVG